MSVNPDKMHLGMSEPDVMVRCALFEKDDEVSKLLFAFYCYAGRPYIGPLCGEGYNPYLPVASKPGQMGAHYRPETVPEDAIAWELPVWALAVSCSLQSLVKTAESIGKETGYSRGLAYGKSWLKGLAAGEITSDEFNVADGRTKGRLNRKSW